MARGRNSASIPSSRIGDMVFYNYRGRRSPAIVVGFDESNPVVGTATLNVFTEDGVQLVRLAPPGEGDMEYSATPPGDVKFTPVIIEDVEIDESETDVEVAVEVESEEVPT